MLISNGLLQTLHCSSMAACKWPVISRYWPYVLTHLCRVFPPPLWNTWVRFSVATPLIYAHIYFVLVQYYFSFLGVLEWVRRLELERGEELRLGGKAIIILRCTYRDTLIIVWNVINWNETKLSDFLFLFTSSNRYPCKASSWPIRSYTRWDRLTWHHQHPAHLSGMNLPDATWPKVGLQYPAWFGLTSLTSLTGALTPDQPGQLASTWRPDSAWAGQIGCFRFLRHYNPHLTRIVFICS